MYEHRAYPQAEPVGRNHQRTSGPSMSVCLNSRTDPPGTLTAGTPGAGIPRRPTAATIGWRERSEGDTVRAGGGSVVGMDSAVAEDAFPSSAAPHPTANISLGGLRGRLYAAVACAALYHVYLLFALWREWAHGPDMCRPVWLLALATAGVHVMVVGRTVMARFSHSIIASMDALGYNERVPAMWMGVFVGGLCLLVYDARDHLSRLASLGGILVLVAIDYVLSSSRKSVPWLVLARALTLQYAAAALMLRWPAGRRLVVCLSLHIARFFEHASEGSRFLFGYLATGANLSFAGGATLALQDARNGSATLSPILAFSAMPVIFYVGFCVNVLYYWGVMQAIVSRLGGFLNHVVGSTACESMCAAGNMLFGLEQSALMLYPYLPHATKAELHCFMTSGFASMSAVMMGSYIALGVETQHLVTAAVLAAPSSLLFSKLLFPETEELRVLTVRIYTHSSSDSSVLEAGAKGAMACLALVGGIVANIVAFMAFIHFLNAVFRWAADILGQRDVTFESLLGKAFTPLALSMGVPWQDCADVGEVIGIKVVANEFIAYHSLLAKKLDARSTMLATYALSGFGNLCSVGVMLGSLAALCPRRLADASEVAFRALLAGCSASILSACVAGSLTDT
ncbi:putative transporter YutK isoform X1 [Amblyomma americanum]